MPRSFLVFSISLFAFLSVSAQELLTPLRFCPRLAGQSGLPAAKQSAPLRLPFFDDFSNYLGQPDLSRWQPSGAWVNRDYDALPPTLGMATLDALDANGALYSHASELFPADTLQSLPIRLDSLWDASPRRTRLSDSVCLSFYYLPGGGEGPEWQHVGIRPGERDSLILEFWDQSTWRQVWATGGVSVDSLVAATGHRWQRVAVMIEDEAFLSAAFAFRFRNLCSHGENPQGGMLGNTDQWLLDYIHLDAHRSRMDSTMHDVAFVSAPPSMLRDYQSMPVRQYNASEMAEQLKVVVSNRYVSPIATHYWYTVLDAAGAEVAAYDGGYANVQPFLPGEVYQTAPAHAQPPVEFVFPLEDDEAVFQIRHEVREGVGGDDRGENDVMTFRQVFANYYAYDDGLPEKGYGVVAAGQTGIASMFPLNVTDTLTAVDLWFNPTVDHANASIPFRLTVWDDAAGLPGRVLYSDESLRHADTLREGSFQRFVLERPVEVSGKVYVGLVQQSAGYINLGFDCGHDHHNRCFYSTDNRWHATVYSGSLMLRPCFGHAAAVGIAPVATSVSLSLWPNPVRDCLQVRWTDTDLAGGTMQIYDMMGRCLATAPLTAQGEATLSTSQLSQGVYLLVLCDRNGCPRTQKRFVK